MGYQVVSTSFWDLGLEALTGYPCYNYPPVQHGFKLWTSSHLTLREIVVCTEKYFTFPSAFESFSVPSSQPTRSVSRNRSIRSDVAHSW